MLLVLFCFQRRDADKAALGARNKVWERQRRLFLYQRHLWRLISQFATAEAYLVWRNHIKACGFPAIDRLCPLHLRHLLFYCSFLFPLPAYFHYHLPPRCTHSLPLNGHRRRRVADIPPAVSSHRRCLWVVTAGRRIAGASGRHSPVPRGFDEPRWRVLAVTTRRTRRRRGRRKHTWSLPDARCHVLNNMSHNSSDGEYNRNISRRSLFVVRAVTFWSFNIVTRSGASNSVQIMDLISSQEDHH